MSKDKKNITNKKIKMINTILIILNILPKNVVPNVNNQVVVNQESVSNNLESNLDKFFKDLDNTLSSFKATFPNLGHNEEIEVIPINVARKFRREYFTGISKEKLESISYNLISKEIGDKLSTKYTITDKQSEEIITGIIEIYNSLGNLNPKGPLGDYTINESLMYK